MRKTALFFIIGLLTIPAFGDPVDVATLLKGAYGGDWTSVADNSSTWTGSFDMALHSSVYENSDGDLTFVYDLVPTVDGVFALNIAGDFSSAEQAAGLHNRGGAGTLFFNVDFEQGMSVIIQRSVDTGDHFIFSFLLPSSANSSWGLHFGNALGGVGGYTTGEALIPNPEPATLTLLGIGLLGGGVARFRKRFK